MVLPSQILPSKCCCCSLRAGSIVVASFALIVAFIFLGLTAGASSMLSNRCSDGCDTSLKMVGNMMTLLTVLNAVEAAMSVSLIWGASKLILKVVRGWLIVSASWILLHSNVAIAYAFATTDDALQIVTIVVGLFIFGMSLLCMVTVMSFHQEIINSLPYSNVSAQGPSRSAEEPHPPYSETDVRAEI